MSVSGPLQLRHLHPDYFPASKTLFARAKAAGIQLRGNRTRTGPLNEQHLGELGLLELQIQMSNLAGRDVSFMIYRNVDAITVRGDAIFTK